MLYLFNFLVTVLCSPLFFSCAGMLKLHPAQSSSQQTVLTIPANQLKQLSGGSGSSALQTILMPVGKGNSTLFLLYPHSLTRTPDLYCPEGCESV